MNDYFEAYGDSKPAVPAQERPKEIIMADKPPADDQERPDGPVQDDTKDSNPAAPRESGKEVEREVEDDDRFQATDN